MVTEGADIDDAHRPRGRVLCSRREERKEQFGEIKVSCVCGLTLEMVT